MRCAVGGLRALGQRLDLKRVLPASASAFTLPTISHHHLTTTAKKGAQGVISLATLRMYASLRELGVRLVVVTGARTATLLARLPFIPAADAYVSEGGGRIFYPASGAGLPTAAPLVEDLMWRQRHVTTAGPSGQDGIPPQERAGSLWAFFAQLQALGADSPRGLKADALSYTTAFRLKGAPEAVDAALKELPDGLATALNLGAADVFPATSGKVRGCVCERGRVGMRWPLRSTCAQAEIFLATSGKGAWCAGALVLPAVVLAVRLGPRAPLQACLPTGLPAA